jgi:transcriptional regulator with XRE-family HTH domain
MVTPDAEAMRQAIKERGITVTRLARQIRRHPQSIWNILSLDKTSASEVFIRQIASALKVDISEIVKPAEDADDEPEADAA